MALHWPTFFTRLGSAVVFAIIMMAGLLWNEWSFLALVAAIQVLCLRDYFRLGEKLDNGKTDTGLKVMVQGMGLLLLAALFWQLFVPEQTITLTPSFWPSLLFVPTLVLLRGALSKHSSWQSALYGIGGIAYIMLPCVLLLFLRSFHWVWPLALILMIWTNDTMAYLVGSFIGKTPFSEISPKKTWEGTAGGALLTVAGAAVWAYFSDGFRVMDAVAVSLCAAVAGTAGDLLESKLKRMAGVKDSGTLMPGHGGALDRFDSLLVATPFAFCYLYFISL